MSHGIELLTTSDYATKLEQCIHCGLCLQACPTYAVFNTEMDGPRGRIALMRSAASGRFAPDAPGFVEHIDRCLGCRACETACPSGVQYGALVSQARIVVEHHRAHGITERFIRWLGLRQLMPHLGRLKLVARLAWLYQRSGLQPLVRRLDLLPRPLKAMEAILPPVDPQYRDNSTPAAAMGQWRGRVAFLIGCIQEAFLAPVNAATIRVLQRNGYEVIFPLAQTCCGAAQLHVGELDLARDLARRSLGRLPADADTL
jgi:glycolate oxidase iron-sulfur subunit